MTSIRVVAVLICLLVAGCTAPSASAPLPTGSPSAAASTSPTESAGAPSAGSPTGGPGASGPAGSADPTQVEVVLEPFLDGLAGPLDLATTGDGSGRVYVVEQPGRIRAFEADGIEVPGPYLDIADRLLAGGERGLLGLAFHPGFAEDGRLFVSYTDLRGNDVIAQFSGDADRADPDSEQVLIEIEDPYPNHNGGGLAFDADGRLLTATGDGGSGGDPHGNGQSVDTLLGKILRIDVDAGGDAPYAIPADNPFASGGGEPEILHYGMRNPFRISVDRETGDLWMGDVGQNRLEELDRAAAESSGLNFGWNLMEGADCFRPDCSREGLTLPLVSYGRDIGSVVTGGRVYRGQAQPLLAGIHVFADFASGAVFGIRADAAPSEPIAEPPVLAATDLSIAAIGEDDAGELYAVDLGGGVYRVTARAR